MTAAENKTMVQVMFALFVAMFAATAMDVKQYMHGRAAIRQAPVLLPEPSNQPAAGEADLLPRQFQGVLEMVGRDTAPSSGSPHPGLRASAAASSLGSHRRPGMRADGEAPAPDPMLSGLSALDAGAAASSLGSHREPGMRADGEAPAPDPMLSGLSASDAGAAASSLGSHREPWMRADGGAPAPDPVLSGLLALDAGAAAPLLPHDQRSRQPESFWEPVAVGKGKKAAVNEPTATRVEIRPLCIDEDAGRVERGRMARGPESAGGNRE